MSASEWEPLDGTEEEHEYDARRQHGTHSVTAPSARGFGHSSSSNGGAASSSNSDVASSSGKTLTRDMVIKAAEKTGLRTAPALDGAALAQKLAKLTHLHLNGLRIGKIDNLRGLPNLETLYLYDNRIEVIENLNGLENLTHLYLSDNLIREVSGLGALTNLQKLYLQGNYITRVTGLHNLMYLEELHISSQKLGPGERLEFEPASMMAVAPTLRVLCAIQCNLKDDCLEPLGCLRELRKLELASNSLTSVEAIEGVLRPASRLLAADFRGNPVCKGIRYRESIILASDSIAQLDDEPVQAQQREALLRFNISRMKAQIRAEEGPASAGMAAAAAGMAGAPPGGMQGYGYPSQPGAAGGLGGGAPHKGAQAAAAAAYHRHTALPRAGGFNGKGSATAVAKRGQGGMGFGMGAAVEGMGIQGVGQVAGDDLGGLSLGMTGMSLGLNSRKGRPGT